MTKAQMIANELINVVGKVGIREQFAEYGELVDFREHESIVRIRLGGSYDGAEWSHAVALLHLQMGEQS